MHDGAPQRQPLPPAARQVACDRALASLEARHLEHERAAALDLPVAQTVEPSEERDVLLDRQSVRENRCDM